MLFAPVTLETVKHKRIVFYASLVGSIGLMTVIHVSAEFFVGDPLLHPLMVMLFFGCLASVPWSFADPYRELIEAEYRWRYAEAGPAIQRNIEMLLIRKAAFVKGFAVIGVIAALCLGLRVAAAWPAAQPLLGEFSGLLTWGALGGLAGLPLYGVFRLRLVREIGELGRQIREEMRIGGLSERTAADEARQRKLDGGPGVEVTEPLRFRAGGHDWRWDDFYKNVAVFGQTGSGKTLCVLNALLDGLIASSGRGETAAAGLILDPKGDFREKVAELCRIHGRARDLLVLDPYELQRSFRWNPLDTDDDPLEIAGRFGAVMEVLSPSGKDDKFWIQSSTRLVQNLVTLLRAAYPERPPSLVDVYDAAMSDVALDRVGEAVNVQAGDRRRDLRRALDFFFDEWKPMDEKPRGSIRTFVGNMLGPFLVEPYDELFAGRSTWRIADAIDQGRIIYVYMPIADREVMAKVVCTFIKLEFYRAVLQRPNKRRPSFFLCDEFQSFFTVGQGRGDADAFERTRQSNHANVIAFQNLNALLKQTDKREPVENLLGNCATKLFLRNTDSVTNEFASKLFGQQIETLTSISTSVDGRTKRGEGAGSIAGSAQYAARVKPDDFVQLAVPSQEDGVAFAEAMAHLAARGQVETKRLRWKVHPLGER